MAKIGRFWPKTAKQEFFSKIRLEHFLVSPRSDARISRYRVTDGRTHARTHARTNERESIGTSANAERPINMHTRYSIQPNKKSIRPIEHHVNDNIHVDIHT